MIDAKVIKVVSFPKRPDTNLPTKPNARANPLAPTEANLKATLVAFNLVSVICTALAKAS